MAIESRWFRCPETGSGDEDDPKRPVIADRVDSFACFRPEPNSMAFVVRAYAEPEVLDSLEDEPGVTELPREMAANALNASEHRGVYNTKVTDADELEELFRLGPEAHQ